MLEDELGFSRFMKVYKYIQVMKDLSSRPDTDITMYGRVS
jgi:hypothetical protein